MSIAALSSWWHSRRLVAKHTLIVLAVGLALIPATYAIIVPAQNQFLEIEQSDVSAQTARAQSAMRMFEEKLNKSLGDYGFWDDSFNYMAAPNRTFEQATLGSFTMKNMGVDAITYVRFDGKVIYANAADLETAQSIPEESRRFAELTSQGAFFEAAKAKQNHLAYVRTPRGVYVVYSQWANNSAGTAKPIGFLVMANLLSPAMLSDALQANARLNLGAGGALALDQRYHPTSVKTTADRIETSLGLFGQDGKVLATINFETPRSLMIAGKGAARTLTVGLLIGLGLMLSLLVWGIRRISVSRLEALDAYVRHYRENPPLSDRVIKGDDEIAVLARSFQTLSGELANAEEGLRQKSYLQGKADSAAGMLHNVRNALAPIRVLQEKWLAQDGLPYRANMVRAAAELADEALDSGRRSQLEAFLLSSAKAIALEAGERRREMTEAKESIDQVAAILSSYNYDTSSTSERVDLAALLQREIKSLAARGGEAVEFELPEAFPAIEGNAIHLGQVVSNLLVNADEAMIAAKTEPKRMVVSVTEVSGDAVEIAFQDNGDGIAPENLARIYQRGYSTRSHKSGGLGMHWSANAMRAMGGSIRVESDGLGHGARAVLTLRKVAESRAEVEPILSQAA
jgi:signal transduction histidine kinase